MSTPQWQPGTTYLPGAIVTPRSNSIVLTEEPNNNSFEDGLTHWTVTGEYVASGTIAANASSSTGEAYDGSTSATVHPTAGNGTGPHTASGKPVAFAVFTNDLKVAVVPGKSITFNLRAWHLFVPSVNDVYAYGAGARIAWYKADNTFISYSYASSVSAGSQGPIAGMFAFQDANWVTISGTGIAPAGAAFAAAVGVIATTDYSTQAVYIDYFTWNYTVQGYPPGLVFVAVQANPGTSGTSEPVWPVNSGSEVTDNNVTWEAEFASLVTWTASSILKSGSTEPAWPTAIGASVADGTIVWTATDGRITDPNCPQSKIVAIASAKVYAADNDIVRYCATTNPQDWSSSQDAGFIPFGLNNFGNEPVKAMNLYRSNLVIANSLGYQMWQVDPDPANIDILDSEPVGCDANRSMQPANNDLIFYSPAGIRNIGTVGASGNLQAGQFGKQVDPIVNALIKAANAAGVEVISLFNPGTGQYWLIIGDTVIVLSINGASAMSWSRYTFPSDITDYTVQDGALYLRAGDLVWELSDTVLYDDVAIPGTTYFTMTSASADFEGQLCHGYSLGGVLESDGAFGSINSGGNIAGFPLNSFCNSDEDSGEYFFFIELAGDATATSWCISFTDKNGTAWTFNSADGGGVFEDSATIYSWTYNGGALPPEFADNAVYTVTSCGDGGTSTGFQGYMSWNYLDCGPVGIDKMFEGYDLVVGNIDDDGEVTNNDVNVWVSFGYNSANKEMATEPFMITGDTIPGTMVPEPMTAPSFQMRLDFGYGQNWGWAAANLYVGTLWKQ